MLTLLVMLIIALVIVCLVFRRRLSRYMVESRKQNVAEMQKLQEMSKRPEMTKSSEIPKSSEVPELPGLPKLPGLPAESILELPANSSTESEPPMSETEKVALARAIAIVKRELSRTETSNAILPRAEPIYEDIQYIQTNTQRIPYDRLEFARPPNSPLLMHYNHPILAKKSSEIEMKDFA